MKLDANLAVCIGSISALILFVIIMKLESGI